MLMEYMTFNSTYVDLGPDLTEMFTMWGTLSKLMDDDYISISTYILNGIKV